MKMKVNFMAKPKKLKRISSEVVSYVRINGQAAKDEHDKMLAVSYAHSKMDMIDWYISLIDCNSDKYIVPQSREELVSIRNQLAAAIERIIEAPIKPKATISVEYPKGYEG
jgi:propanediol dehydratase large subunit